MGSITAFFILFAVFFAAIQWVPRLARNEGFATSTLALLNSMRQPAILFVPLIALSIGYDVITRERESGSIKILIGLPNTRCEAVFGKFIGRTIVVAIAILVGYLAAGFTALITYESFDFAMFGVYTLLTVVYGAVYIALAIGCSAGMSSSRWAFGGAMTLYGLFLLGWDALLYALQMAIYGSQPPKGGLPSWFDFLHLLNPSTAFMYAARSVIPEYSALSIAPPSNAFYVQNWVGFVVLAFWIIVPLSLGYFRFERADIE